MTKVHKELRDQLIKKFKTKKKIFRRLWCDVGSEFDDPRNSPVLRIVVTILATRTKLDSE